MNYISTRRLFVQPLACAIPSGMSRLLNCVLLALLFLAPGGVFAQSPYPQRVDPQINDFAGVLTDADKTSIRNIQAQLLGEHGAELVVATIGSFADYDVADKTLEAFATKLFNSWGIGDRQRNDGVLLLVAVRDRRVRIEVGSGYGARYNDAMQHVIDDDILPAFRDGAYGAGIVSGVGGIQAALAGTPSRLGALLVSPLVISAALIAAAAIFIAARATLRRRRQHGATPAKQVMLCQDCRRPMDELGIELISADLDAGQRVEHQLRSVNHQLWECRSCGSRKRRSSPGATLRYRACPQCRYQTLEEDEHIAKAPTATQRGLKVTTRHCHHCGYSTEFKTKLAQKRSGLNRSAALKSSANSAFSSYDSDSSTSSSASSYDYGSSTSYDSGSSSSDSGGSSSGDGASGSW